MLAYYYLNKTAKNKNEAEFSNYYGNLLRSPPQTNKNLSSRCRVCLKEACSSKYGRENTAEINDTLKVFGNITINEDDQTKLLCSVCYKFIKEAFAFRKVAMRSDQFIKQAVKNEVTVKVENMNNTFDDSFDDKDNSDDTPLERPRKIQKTSSDCSVTKNHEEVKPFENQLISKEKVKEKKNPKVSCHICNKVVTKSAFKQHLLLHDPDGNKHVCHVCGKTFRLKITFYQHSLRHRTDFSFKCQYCPYRARYGELLKSHMRTHTGDYKYVCTVCPSRFLYISNLKRHMWKHQEPQFKCDACKRAFHTQHMLQQHYDSDHLGIKNHVCNICGNSFGSRNNMMKHQRGVHKRARYAYSRMPSYLKAENIEGASN